MDASARAVLVTGGAGYIGSHAAKALHQAGYRVVVFDNLVAGHRGAVKFGELVEGDSADVAAVRAVLRRHQIRSVMHFAAFLDVGESVRDPFRYYRNNVVGTLGVLEAMAAESATHFVFSSTCATYGEPIETPITESHPQQPINAYGESKLAIERALPHVERAHGIRWASLRYFNAAGADPDGELGEDHSPEIHLIPRAIDAATGGPGLRVFGDDYPTPDGSAVRDYIHVLDLASAHEKALDYLAAGGPSGALNLGTGAGSSVLEIVKAAQSATGRPIPIEKAPRRPGDAAALVADPAEARKRIGWTAEHSGLPEILADAWRWHQARFARKSDRA